MNSAEILLLGSPEIRLPGGDLARLSADSSWALLAYLVLHPGILCRRDALQGLLWPDVPDDDAAHNLRQALYRLRQALGDGAAGSLRVERRTIAWFPDDSVQVDVNAFEAAQAGATELAGAPQRVARLAEALALYRGDLLEGVTRISDAYEEWLTVERERLRLDALSVLEELAGYHQRHGEHEQVLYCARRQLALDPWHERALRMVMGALAAQGQRAEALLEYETFRQGLEKDLDICPDEETRGLYERLRFDKQSDIPGQRVAARPDPRAEPHNLPAAVDSFVGRERELGEVLGLLRDPGVRLVTLVGAGGMGKTRLAFEAARQALSAYPEGVWLVDLAPLPATDDGALVVRAVEAVLGVREDAGLDGLCVALRDRRLLLLVDNCEHVLGSVVPLVSHLLQGCPALTVLATSREPLHASGEHVYPVPPLTVPEALPEASPVQVVSEYGALRLFADRASAAQFGMVIDTRSLAAAVSVCQRLDGMPLAIELAAARLSSMTVAELARGLESSRADGEQGEDRWALLSAGSRAARPRQRTLQATVAWSYGLLEERQRLLFNRLSAFSGTFDLDAVAAVAASDADGDLVPAEVPALLAALVDCSLVQRVQSPGGAFRYRLLETLRVFALERLAERGETERVAGRHAGYYLQLTESLEPVLRTNTPEAVVLLFRLDADRDNLATAIRWCLAHHRPETAVGIAGAVEFWAVYHTYLQEYAAYVRQGLANESELPPLVRAKAWDLIALYAFNWGRNEEFAAAAQAELQAAWEAEDGYWIGYGMERLGLHAQVIGDHERAEALFQQSLDLWRKAGAADSALLAEVLLCGYMPAGERLRHAEGLLPANPNPCQAYFYQLVGGMCWAEGALARAEDHLRTAERGWADMGNRTLEAALTSRLGSLRLLRGACAEEVLELGARSTRLARTTGHLPAYIERQWARGDMLWHLGLLSGAQTALEEALAQAVQYGEQGLAPLIRESLAQVHVEQGDIKAAQVACEAAAPGSQDDDGSVRLLDARSRLATLRRDTAEAVRLMRLALERARGSTSRPEVARATEHLAWALADAGGLDEATALLAAAQSERDAMGMVLYPVEVPHHARAVRLVGGGAA
jgi:predicted ATPase/DNA-binding SARP family transcriptional activator